MKYTFTHDFSMVMAVNVETPFCMPNMPKSRTQIAKPAPLHTAAPSLAVSTGRIRLGGFGGSVRLGSLVRLGAFTLLTTVGLVATTLAATSSMAMADIPTSARYGSYSAYAYPATNNLAVAQLYTPVQSKPFGYNSGWHGGYPDTTGKKTTSSQWQPNNQVVINVYQNAPLMADNRNRPVSVHIQAPTSQSSLPAGWYKSYHPGDVLERHIYNNSQVLNRMPRGVVRIKVDNVIIQLNEGSRQIISISAR